MGRIEEFDQLRRLKQQLNIEQDRLNKLTASICVISSSDESSGKVDGGGLNTTEDKYINIVDMCREQQKAVKECEREYWQLENIIFNKIREVSKKNQLCGVVLYERFINLTSPHETANIIRYSRTSFYRYQEEALKIYSKL